MKLDKSRTLKIIKAALKEDIGIGDITTANTVSNTESVKASIVVKEECVICGIEIAEWIIGSLDPSVRYKPQVQDGQRVYGGKEIVFLEGHARAILTAERTILNFLSFLSGIATNVSAYVEKASKYGVEIYDTRKTFPLLRYLEKYAVLTGGGSNHRFGLWDQALVKDNHIRIIKHRDRQNIVSKLRDKLLSGTKIEIEVESIEEYEVFLKEKPDIIMLDNMSIDDIRKAALLRNGIKAADKPILEVSGGITLDNVEEYAKTGVDRISIGSLTDSVSSIDIGLEILE